MPKPTLCLTGGLGLIVGLTDEEKAGANVNHLMSVMRGLNSLAGSPGEVSHEVVADLLDRYSQAIGQTAKVEESEHRSVSEQISKMQPGELIVYLTEWLQSKRM
jgi:hypothetical protein